MKYTLRVPTNEQYAYIECAYEGDADGAVVEYEYLTRLAKGGAGMDNKSFIKVLDELWVKESISGDPGMIEEMSHSQQEIIRAIKLIIKRNK